MRFNEIKKIFILIGTASIVSLSIVTPVKAQNNPNAGIIAVLNQILQRVDKLPTELLNLGNLTLAWMSPDTSPPSVSMQQNFLQLNQLSQNMSTQLNLQPALNNYMLSNSDGQNVYASNGGKKPTGVAPKATTFPYANDILYSTIMGLPYYAKDPRPGVDNAMNYVLNASGANMYHAIPGNWQGAAASQTRYQNYFNTVMAATSFNNYVLSYQYADKTQFNTLQTTLIQQATDQSNWFAQVAKENIGFVLRQMLIYESQIFVLLTQMIQFQKQMVAAQTMNTSVLIAINQLNEAALVSYAKGQRPAT